MKAGDFWEIQYRKERDKYLRAVTSNRRIMATNRKLEKRIKALTKLVEGLQGK